MADLQKGRWRSRTRCSSGRRRLLPSSSRPLAGPLRLCVPSLFHVARLASLYQSIYLSPRPSLSYSLVSLRSANVTEAPEASHSSDQPSPAALPPRVAPPLELEVAHEVEPLHEAPSGPHVAGQPGQAPVQAPGPIRTDPHTVSASPNSPNYLLGSCLLQLVQQHQSQMKLKASVYPKTVNFFLTTDGWCRGTMMGGAQAPPHELGRGHVLRPYFAWRLQGDV